MESALRRCFTIRVILFLLFSLLIVATIQADTISLASVGTAADPHQTNTIGNTIAIAPDRPWASALSGSSWVSFASTGKMGPGFQHVTNGTVVSFTDVFNLSGTPSGGTLRVMADDSATVLLNGSLLMGEASMTGNGYHTCSDFGIGCLKPTTINLPGSDLHTGSNTLVFEVAQRGGFSFGLDYAGSVNEVLATPELASVTLTAFGLMMLAGLVYLRKRGLEPK
jgi:hypothetical protein